MQLKPVEEQVVALMGASSGIGRETALRFACEGAKVVVSARGEEGLNSLVTEVRGKGGEAITVVADTSEFVVVPRFLCGWPRLQHRQGMPMAEEVYPRELFARRLGRGVLRTSH